jgi:putative heme iron utilization protein
MEKTIEELVDRITTQDYANAQPMFAELMASKLEDAIDAEKIKVANQVFNNVEEPDDEDEIDESNFDDEDYEEIPDEE